MEDAAESRALLENSQPFKGFAPHIIDAIIPLLIPCSFKVGNIICMKGDASDCLYIIREGEVEVSVSSQEGKIIILGTLSRGNVFGEVGLLDKKSRTANVMAITDVSLYRLDSDEFDKIQKLFGTNELIALTSYICLLFRRATSNLEETVFLDAGIRIAKNILKLYEKNTDNGKNDFMVEISQENLGRMAGLSREAANKALSRLEETGLIKREYKRIHVPDMKKFAEMLEVESILMGQDTV